MYPRNRKCNACLLRERVGIQVEDVDSYIYKLHHIKDLFYFKLQNIVTNIILQIKNKIPIKEAGNYNMFINM